MQKLVDAFDRELFGAIVLALGLYWMGWSTFAESEALGLSGKRISDADMPFRASHSIGAEARSEDQFTAP